MKKSLYGLKQSPRQWYMRFDEHMISCGFKRSSYDNCVYFKEYNKGNFVYLLLYVDDMLVACKDKKQIDATKVLLKGEFDMKELGVARKILGMEITRDRNNKRIWLSQKSYVDKVLKTYHMQNRKAVVTPLAQHFKLSSQDCPKCEDDVKYMENIPYASVVGSLMYMMVCTRPDIGYAVSLVSRYLSNPGKNHWEAAKWILRYLNGTRNYGLLFGRGCDNGSVIQGFVDADFAKDLDKGRSITGYAFMVLGSLVSWKASLQHVVALSTTESEYIALTEGVKEAIWLKGFVSELGIDNVQAVVHCDSQGAIQLSRNSIFHERTKHINVKLHFIRDIVQSKEIEIKQVDTKDNAADMLTKVLPSFDFENCLGILGIC